MKKAVNLSMTLIAFSLLTACNDSGKGIQLEQEQSTLGKSEIKVEAEQSKLASSNPVPSLPLGTSSGNSKGIVRVVKTTTSQIALKQLEEKDYFGTIVATVEGYRANFYPDNIYPAIGFGWNFAPTSKATNRRLATGAGLDKGLTEQLLAVSPQARLSPEQAMKSAHEFEKQLIEQPAISFFGASTWNKLADNQKAVLQYHFYKTGTAGGSKYIGLKKAVMEYASNKSQSNSDAVVSHITYNYKIKVADGTWKQMTDKRSQLYMGTLWNSTEAYGALIGQGKFAPATMSQFTNVAKISKVEVNPDSSKALADQVDDQDELIQAKNKAAEEGQSIQLEQVIDGKTVPYTTEPQAQTEVHCIGKTTLCSAVKKEQPATTPKPQATAPAQVAPTVEAPRVQGSCKTGSYEATMKLPNGQDLKYCVITSK